MTLERWIRSHGTGKAWKASLSAPVPHGSQGAPSRHKTTMEGRSMAVAGRRPPRLATPKVPGAGHSVTGDRYWFPPSLNIALDTITFLSQSYECTPCWIEMCSISSRPFDSQTGNSKAPLRADRACRCPGCPCNAMPNSRTQHEWSRGCAVTYVYSQCTANHHTIVKCTRVSWYMLLSLTSPAGTQHQEQRHWGSARVSVTQKL